MYSSEAPASTSRPARPEETAPSSSVMSTTARRRASSENSSRAASTAASLVGSELAAFSTSRRACPTRSPSSVIGTSVRGPLASTTAMRALPPRKRRNSAPDSCSASSEAVERAPRTRTISRPCDR
jgi:hypothetical protein